MQKIESKYINLRTRIKRLVRPIICFSKTEKMHDLVIGLFINRYELAHYFDMESTGAKHLHLVKVLIPIDKDRPAIIAWISRQGGVVIHATRDFTVKTGAWCLNPPVGLDAPNPPVGDV